MGYKVLAGRYEIHEKIGDGGMAVVYSARDKLLNRLVAIKILRPDFVKDESFVENFRKESRAAAGLNHPNIVSIFDVGKDGNIYYIVMELVQGRPLSEIIAERAPMPFREVINVGVQIASALAFAHKNNIIHRDVKPHNILVTEDDDSMHAKIADFGIARAVTDNTTVNDNGTIVGSVHYFSPEQARGKYVDEKSDIYSLGIVLYEMTTGRVPFDATEPISIALMHMNEPMLPPTKVVEGVPPGLERVILKATQKVQVNRFASVDEMKDALENAGRLADTFGDAYVFGGGSFPQDDGGFADDVYAGDASYQEGDYADGSYAEGTYEDGYNGGYDDDWDEDDIDEGLVDGRMSRDNASEPEPMMQSGGKGKRKKSKKPNDPESRKNRKIRRLAVIIAILAAAALCYPIYMGINWVFSEKGSPVPDIVGLTEDEATKKVGDSKFKLEFADPKFSDDVETGKIIEQTPEAGKKEKDGTIITAVLSKGVDPDKEQPPDEEKKETVEELDVPDLVGKSSEGAQTAIYDAGFKPGKVVSVDSEKAKGTVLSQNPSAGTKLAKGGEIEITISLGPKTKETTVPNLLGLTKSEANGALSRANLKLGSVSEEYSDDYPQGQVIWQQYQKGATIEEEKTVNITLSKGPKDKTSTVNISIDFSKAPAATFKLSVLLVPENGSQKYILKSEPRLQANGSEDVAVTGTGKGKVIVYFDDELYKQYSVNFNTGKVG